jgi:hypothetical protein
MYCMLFSFAVINRKNNARVFALFFFDLEILFGLKDALFCVNSVVSIFGYYLFLTLALMRGYVVVKNVVHSF